MFSLVFTVNSRSPLGDFDQPVEDLVRIYVSSRWNIITPNKSTNPPFDFSNKVRFTDFDYDGYATYHVKIKEDVTTFDNDLIGQGFLGFITPIIFQITARRLKYGKTFEELDNIRLEIVRIIGNYAPDEIPGITHMDIVDSGDIQPQSIFINKLPHSIYRAQVTANVFYDKQWY